MKDYLLFSGSSNINLAKEVAVFLKIKLADVELTRFADGELRPWVKDDVRDKIVFVLESLSFPMDEHVMELALLGDAIRRSAPRTMVAVIPYMGYARQDKQHRVGEPISARVIAKFLEVSKFKEMITVDLHNDAIVGFFQVPVTHVSALSELAKVVSKESLENGIVVSPDVGGVKRARNFAYALDLPMIVMEKKRFIDRHDTTESYQIIGDVSGKKAIIIDDIISTGGTTAQAALSLRAAGATSVIVCATHAVCAGDAATTLTAAPIDRLIVTNTIALPLDHQPARLETVSIAPVIAQAIEMIISHD